MDATQTAYRPTSLDFINLPNPIEPYAGSQRHPLNGTPRLEKARPEASANNHFRLILEDEIERPQKRQKTIDNLHLDLPKLPTRNGPKRPRIPPTLSGLHQPPPDAGLLPSISVDKPPTPPSQLQSVSQLDTPQQALSNLESATTGRRKLGEGSGQLAPAVKKRVKRNKWSEEETASLLKGVARFGIGNWTTILRCEDYTFSNRTALDLKDRFRVCCPEQYKKPSRQSMGKENLPTTKKNTSTVSSSKLRELGINAPLVKSGRRARHGYTSVEDDALLEGFRKHGAQWALIRQDAEAELSGRRPTDLRDRFRTRFPDEYAKAGLTSRKDKNADVSSRHAGETTDIAAGLEPESSAQAITKPGATVPQRTMPSLASKDEVSGTKAPDSRRPQQPAPFSLDNVFLWSALGSDEEDAEAEPIVLDRGILDWPGGDANRTNSTDPSKTSGINPLMTLKLPKPHASLQTPVPAVQQPAQATNTNALPSLAAMFPDAATSESLELPSLMTWLGPMDAEGKNGTFPSLEELFS